MIDQDEAARSAGERGERSRERAREDGPLVRVRVRVGGGFMSNEPVTECHGTSHLDVPLHCDASS